MRSIRSLGLAVLTVAALAVVPAMASASGGIVADKYATALIADDQGELLATIGTSPGSYCNFGEALKGEISGPSATYALSGTGATCKNGTPVQMNNCKFEFDPASQSFAVGPPTCSSIDTLVGFCKISILPQTGLAAAQASQPGEVDTATISIEAIGAEYEIKKTEGLCWKGVYSSLSLDGDFDLAGYEAEGEYVGPPVDIEVIADGTLPVGVFTAESNFQAQAYPLSYQAMPVPTKQLKILGAGAKGNATCEAAATGKVEGEASALDFTEFSGCHFGGQSATVRTNSCSYRLDTSSVAVVCAEEGDVIEIEMKDLCTVTVPAQSLSGSGYEPENEGEGRNASIAVSSAATDIKYGKVKTLESQTKCLLFPTGENGTFEADVSMSGAYAG